MSKRKDIPICPHCGFQATNDTWKNDSAWEMNRPVGESRCRQCSQWIKMIVIGGEVRSFATWPKLEEAWEQIPKVG